jgi:NitT/TauT family transport system ATP-binding protein
LVITGEAVSMADRIIILSNRPGTVKREIPVELTLDERTPFKARSAPEFKEYFNMIWKELSYGTINS